MTERNSKSYRDGAAAARQRAQDTLKAFREARIAKRAERKTSTESATPTKTAVPKAKKAAVNAGTGTSAKAPRLSKSSAKTSTAAKPTSALAKSSKSDPSKLFRASPETAEIVGKSAHASSRRQERKAPAAKAKPKDASNEKTAADSTLRREIDNNLEQLAKICAETEDTRKQLESMQGKLAAAEATAAARASAAQQAEASLAVSQRSLTDVKAELSTAKAERDQLHHDVRELTAERGVAEASLAKLKKSLEKAQQELLSHKVEFEALEQAIGTAKAELTELNKRIDEESRKANDLHAERDQLEATLPVLHEEVVTAQSQRDVAEEEAGILSSELQDVREKLSENEEYLNRITAERVATEQALVETLASFSRERRKLENLRLQLSEAGMSVAKSLPPSSSPTLRKEQKNSNLKSLPEIGEGMIWHLNKAGIDDLMDLAAANAADLRNKLGTLGELADVDGWIKFAQQESKSA